MVNVEEHILNGDSHLVQQLFEWRVWRLPQYQLAQIVRKD